MILKNFTDKVRTHPIYVFLMILAALFTIFGGIKIQKKITNYNKSDGIEKEKKLLDLYSYSDMEIFNALSINMIIEFDKKTKDFYMFNCPDFNPNAQDHFIWLKECSLLKFGPLGSFDGKIFYYGTYNFSKDYVNEGIIVFEGSNNNDFIEPIIFCAHLDIYPKVPILGYSEPKIIYTKYGPILDASCAIGGGSAIGYDFRYYLWNGSKWILLDNYSWMDDLRNKLPNDLRIWNDEPIDLNNLIYTSYLWKPEDAHCCPTGGRVKVHLIIKKDKFEIDSLKLMD